MEERCGRRERIGKWVELCQVRGREGRSIGGVSMIVRKRRAEEEGWGRRTRLYEAMKDYSTPAM